MNASMQPGALLGRSAPVPNYPQHCTAFRAMTIVPCASSSPAFTVYAECNTPYALPTTSHRVPPGRIPQECSHDPATPRAATRHRGTRPGQELRRGAGPGRHRPDGAAGHRVRPARAERCRKDHHRADPGHLAAPRCGAGQRGRFRHRAGATSRSAEHQPDRTERRHRRAADRRGEPADDGPIDGADRHAVPPPGRRDAGAVRSARRRRASRCDLFRRHAPAPRPGVRPRRTPVGDLPRRTHDGARPAQPAGHVGGDRRAGPDRG